MAKEPVKFKISDIENDLKVLGLDRKGIKAKYGLSHTDMTALFKNPQLKNKKVKKALGFEILPEEGETATVATEDVTANLKAPAPEAVAEAPVAEEAPVPTPEVADKW